MKSRKRSGGMEPIYLVDASLNPSRVMRRLSVHGSQKNMIQPVRWLFLGRDYLKMRSWELSLGKGFERIRYARQLQEIGMKWRRPYLDWIAMLGKQYGGIAWWSSKIAERNTYGYSLYHDICYLQVVRSYGCHGNSPILIVAESRTLLRTISLQEEFKERIRWIGWSFPLRDWVVWILALVFVWARYLIRGFLEMWDARKTRKGHPAFPLTSNKVRVLIHSCMDENYFGKDDSPRDRYYTILPEELRRRGYDVVTIPWLYNLRRSRRDAFEWFRQHHGSYLIPEDYYALGDYLWAAWIIVKQVWLPRGKQVFEGTDVTLLVRWASRWGAVSVASAKFVRYVRLIQKWKQIGLKADVFIDTFENMVTEKPQVIAFRTNMPEVMTVGFQHYLAPLPLMLNMFTTPEEATYAPHPDVIVCNSAFTADLLSKEGFPFGKLRVGPSLRYMHLMNTPVQPVSGNNTVLVILPIDPLVAAEMIHKLWEAFPNDEGIRFLLKVHPMMSNKQWLSTLGKHALPEHMIRVEDELVHCVSEATCAVVAGGTSGLELLLTGVPVAVVGRETDFDLNALAWFPELGSPIHTSHELRSSVLSMLSPSTGARDIARAWAEQYRRRCVSPISNETVDAFVQRYFY